jgi:hypothetical protein
MLTLNLPTLTNLIPDPDFPVARLRTNNPPTTDLYDLKQTTQDCIKIPDTNDINEN